MKISSCLCFFNKSKVSIIYLLLFTVLTCSIFTRANASSIGPYVSFDVSGDVSGINGEMLVGVSVMEKGTTNGVITDGSGKFNLKVISGKAVLVFNYVGYHTKEVAVNSQSVIHVQLNTDIKSLNDVIVVAYSSQQKADVTGSLTTIRADDVKDQPVTLFTQSLQGKHPVLKLTKLPVYRNRECQSG